MIDDDDNDDDVILTSIFSQILANME